LKQYENQFRIENNTIKCQVFDGMNRYEIDNGNYLHHSCKSGNKSLVELLLNKGASFLFRDNDD